MSEETFTVTLPVSMWNVIMAGLSELQFKHSAQTIQAVQQQIQSEAQKRQAETQKTLEAGKKAPEPAQA